MEKELTLSRRDFLKKAAKVGIGTGVVILVGPKVLEGHQATQPKQYSQDIFKPVVIPETAPPVSFPIESPPVATFPIFSSTPEPIPSPSASSTPEVNHLTKKEKQIAEIKKEAKEIYDFAKSSGKFNAKLLAVLHDNLPFYLASQKKYGVDWVVILEMQLKESGGSDPKSRAFDASHANSRVQGSYQIDISWPKEFRDIAFKGLEYTLAFPQRHKGDARDTATATRMLYRNIKLGIQNGASYQKALFKAVSLYCGSQTEAASRLEAIARYDKIFGDLAGNKIKA